MTKQSMDNPEGSEGTNQPFTPEAEVASENEAIIAEKDSRITELTLALSDREAETTALKLAVEESSVIASEAKQSLANAVTAYKVLVVQANPAIPAELIAGNTIEAIAQSLENARALVSTVRANIEAEIAAAKVPAGAPARTAPDLESLSPREKIQYAITKGGK